MAKVGGLGRGLDALFMENNVAVDAKNEIKMVKITDIEPNKEQPRKILDEEKIKSLADSIEEHGIIQPLIVRPIAEGRYQIVAGERRWRASRIAGLKEVPVIVKEYTDKETAEIALVENLQRENLNPIEEAEGYQTLMEEYNMTQDEVAKRVSKSRPAITNSLRLMQLPDDVIDLVKWGKLTAGHGRALVPTGNMAMECAARIIKEGLSVRDTEKMVKKLLTPRKEREKNEFFDEKLYYVREAEKELAELYNRKIKIQYSGKKGKIELEYYDDKDLNLLIDYLKRLG